jgi:AraC-like DNA-binding protein
VDYFLFIWSVVTFIEKRLKTGIDYSELEAVTGFSYRHIRETFKECTKITLARYILARKIENAAFEAIHTTKNLISIAEEYGFESYDTFTRAFKRETGITPVDFRKGEYLVGRRRLAAGAYAPAILRNSKNQLLTLNFKEVSVTMKDSYKDNKSCILYGVPKVQYSFEECTPFPACLKACLNYMGQNIDYAYLMAASGAAFRLRWNTNCWDGGNVDVLCIYENKYEAFERSFKAAGRSYKILSRENSDKNEFKDFIKNEIDCGRPVIALGIIGPPEACIVTGYADNGEALLGWNFFQSNPEFAKDTEIHETGYFITDKWWENNNTLAVISIGENQEELVSQKELISNAIDIMTKPKVVFKNRYGNDIEEYAGGQEAYDAWAKAIGNDKEFSENAILPLLFERIMCQSDAQVMVGEGRSYAACFMEWVARTNKNVEEECIEAAKYFKLAAQNTFKMNELRGGFEQNEAVTKKFAEPLVRKNTVQLILEAKKNEAKACELLKAIVEKL